MKQDPKARSFWIALAHPTIRFRREVTAETVEGALAQASVLFELGDVVIGETEAEVAALAEKLPHVVMVRTNRRARTTERLH